MYRTIEISGEDLHLTVSHGQVVVRRAGEITGRFPAADVGVLIVDTPMASYSHPTVRELLDHGAVIVFCGVDHLPVGMALPSAGHHLHSERLRLQVEAGKPLLKRLWQQIIREKLLRQTAACDDAATIAKLRNLASRVRSGDPDNTEAQGAQAYWRTWLPGTDFRRRREGLWPNPLLNYGYIAFRAAIARSLCAAGFHPALGIRHSNRYNAWCLADDFVEPFRPIVDMQVRQMVRAGQKEIDREAKQQLLSLLTTPCVSAAGIGPFLTALERLTSSYHRCLTGEARELEFPSPVAEPSSKEGTDASACQN